MLKLTPILIVIFFLMTLSACSEDADSEDIRTSGMYASMDVSSISMNQTDVKVSLKVGGSKSNTYVNLTSGDKLTATLNDSDKITLSKSGGSDGQIFYLGGFSSDTAGVENSSIKISFERTSNDTSALNSDVTLPAAPTGLSTSMASFSRGTESVSLTWDAVDSNSNFILSYTGACIKNDSTSVVDIGSYTINAGMIKSSNTQNCQVTFSLSRTVSGTLDPAFGEGGYIEAKLSRSIDMTSSP